MGHVVEHLEEAHRVECPVGKKPRPHDVADDPVAHTRRRTGDCSFTRLDASHIGVSLLQRLLEEEPVTASDLEQRRLATANPL